MTISVYDRLNGGAERSRQLGKTAEDEFLARTRSFDPQSAIATVAGGLFDRFERTAGKRIRDVRGSQVGSGRLATGYGALDESETLFDARSDLNQELAGLALQGEQMNMANTQSLGAFGERQTTQSLDLLAGERDRLMAEQEAKRNRRSSTWGSVLGLAGTLGGAFLGGPLGAGLGGKLGTALAGGR